VRAEQVSFLPASGSASIGEISGSQNAPAVAASPQDEVKVQWDETDQVEIYQFVNQQGSLILQVPSEQLLSLARQISQELVQEAAAQASAAVEGEKDRGH
jgi:methyl coenzyme M reductase beta subunit